VDKITIPCQLMIDPESIAKIFAALGYAPGSGVEIMSPEKEEVEPAADEPTFQVDPDLPLEQQRMSIILQAAAHAHGKVVGGKIAAAWTETDSSGLKMLSTLYPDDIVPLEAIAETIMAMTDVELTGTPAFAWLGGVFKKALEIEPETRPEPEPAPEKPKRGRGKKTKAASAEKERPVVLGLRGGAGGAPCGVCGVAGAHSEGCPGAIADGPGDGGAIPSRARGKTAPHPSETTGAATPFGPGVEVCPVGGYAGGCRLPHNLQFSGGARIPVHVVEEIEKLRAQVGLGPMPATPLWKGPRLPSGTSKSRIVRGRVKG
jgi:hypothetical protein